MQKYYCICINIVKVMYRKYLANKFLLLIEWHKRIIINTRLYVNLSRKGPCIICTFTFHFLLYLGNKCRLFFAVIILCLYMCQTSYVTKNANIPQEKCFHTISFFTKTTPTALETRHAVKKHRPHITITECRVNSN